MQRSFDERHIQLEKINNARDLGGFETKDCNFTRINRYIRSSSLANASECDIESIKSLNVECIIDLRSDYEIEHQPNPFENDSQVSYYPVKLLQDVTLSLLPDDIKNYSSVAGYYIFVIEANKQQFKEIFTLFHKNSYHTILFHCSAGKDRTGIISALLLHLAGCHNEDIVKDYCMSDEYNQEMINNLSTVMEEDKKPFLYAKMEYIDEFIEYLEETYGSAKGYLLSCGLDEYIVDEIIENFVL